MYSFNDGFKIVLRPMVIEFQHGMSKHKCGGNSNTSDRAIWMFFYHIFVPRGVKTYGGFYKRTYLIAHAILWILTVVCFARICSGIIFFNLVYKIYLGIFVVATEITFFGKSKNRKNIFVC